MATIAEMFLRKLRSIVILGTNFNYVRLYSTKNSASHQIVYHMECVCNKDGVNCYKWRPDQITSGNYTVGKGHACMVLNRKIRIPTDVVRGVWENAFVRCTVDGGTNHWRDFLTTQCVGHNMKPPDLITGDFDSITKETQEYFKHPTTRTVHTPDQNATDFTKAIGVVTPLLEAQQLRDIVVFHDCSGRFDHIMANINTIFKVHSSKLSIYLLSYSSMTWLLAPGKHSLTIPKDLVQQERWCSLIPVGARVEHVTTKGLKWNLTSHPMEFGGMVSTSNTYASTHVEIETDGYLLWCMGMLMGTEDE